MNDIVENLESKKTEATTIITIQNFDRIRAHLAQNPILSAKRARRVPSRFSFDDRQERKQCCAEYDCNCTLDEIYEKGRGREAEEYDDDEDDDDEEFVIRQRKMQKTMEKRKRVLKKKKSPLLLKNRLPIDLKLDFTLFDDPPPLPPPTTIPEQIFFDHNDYLTKIDEWVQKKSRFLLPPIILTNRSNPSQQQLLQTAFNALKMRPIVN